MATILARRPIAQLLHRAGAKTVEIGQQFLVRLETELAAAGDLGRIDDRRSGHESLSQTRSNRRSGLSPKLRFRIDFSIQIITAKASTKNKKSAGREHGHSILSFPGSTW